MSVAPSLGETTPWYAHSEAVAAVSVILFVATFVAGFYSSIPTLTAGTLVWVVLLIVTVGYILTAAPLHARYYRRWHAYEATVLS